MSKTMSVELVEALKAAGVELTPAKVELTLDMKVEKIQLLLTELEMAKQAENQALAKKVRRQLRGLGFRLSEFKKANA